jgi:diguanylate cyclase (GGDEF)-like protein
LLLVDVDELKRINSVQGHAGGDRAIRTIARAIRMTARETDIGGRWGGDEFLVIAPSTPAPAAVTLAERLRGQLASMAISDPGVPTSSIGIATCEPGRDARCDPDMLVRGADMALRRAKGSGRNQVRVA